MAAMSLWLGTHSEIDSVKHILHHNLHLHRDLYVVSSFNFRLKIMQNCLKLCFILIGILVLINQCRKSLPNACFCSYCSASVFTLSSGFHHLCLLLLLFMALLNLKSQTCSEGLGIKKFNLTPQICHFPKSPRRSELLR